MVKRKIVFDLSNYNVTQMKNAFQKLIMKSLKDSAANFKGYCVYKGHNVYNSTSRIYKVTGCVNVL